MSSTLSTPLAPKILHPRKAVIDNVNKMINCDDPSYGGAFFGCPDYGNIKFVPFTCKSHFCPSCGNMYNQKCSFHMSSKLISCIHRHYVFTIPEELRSFFLYDRSFASRSFFIAIPNGLKSSFLSSWYILISSYIIVHFG